MRRLTQKDGKIRSGGRQEISVRHSAGQIARDVYSYESDIPEDGYIRPWMILIMDGLAINTIDDQGTELRRQKAYRHHSQYTDQKLYQNPDFGRDDHTRDFRLCA
jgi:hypothetical protein